MASELRVTTIANNAGSESVDTTYVVNGSAKAWANVNQSTPSTRDSLNLSSNTDNSTGNFTANWTSNFSAAEYVAAAMATNDATNYTRGPGGFYQYDNSSMTTSSHRTLACYGSDASNNGNVVDKDYALQMYIGDLA